MKESTVAEGQNGVSRVKRVADWKVAYVIGLAGAILVTGVAGPLVGAIGTWGCILVMITVVAGVVYCFLLAELSAMFPEKIGGLPTYAVEGFRDKRWGGLLGGLNNWAYFLGWSPVIAVNTSILAIYAAVMGGYYPLFFSGILPIWPQGYAYLFSFTLGITSGLYAINYFGLSLGYRAALVFAFLSVGPLLFLGFAPMVTGSVDWSNVFPVNSGQVTAPMFSRDWILAVYPWIFIVTWNSLAMEATASYIGECRNPSRDAPRAMTAAAATGLLIYTSVPLAMLGVLGATSVASDPWGGFIRVASLYAGPYATYVVGLMLFAALLLSTTNALIGCSRSLYQSSSEGLTLRWFGKLNEHGSPYRAMLCGLAFNLGLVLLAAGLPTLISLVSNVGYLFSFIPTGIAYYRLKKGYDGMPRRARPYSLPRMFGGVALVVSLLFGFIFVSAGPLSPYSVYAIAGTSLPPIFFWLLGFSILLLGIPMSYYATRKKR